MIISTEYHFGFLNGYLLSARKKSQRFLIPSSTPSSTERLLPQLTYAAHHLLLLAVVVADCDSSALELASFAPGLPQREFGNG